MKKAKQSLLWKVSHEAMPKSSFLFGTMHLLDERAMPLLDAVLPYLADTEQFVAETAIDEMNNLSQDYMYLPEGQTIEQHLSPQKIKRIDNAFRRYAQMSFSPMKNIHPLFLLQFFVGKAIVSHLEYRLDDLLWQEATLLEKPCFGIESVSEQLDIYQAMSIEKQYFYLSKSVGHISTHNRMYKKLADLYAENEAYSLYQRAKRSLHESRRTLLYERNKRMTSKIKQFLLEKPSFITFGAGHLLGEKGIVRLLKKEGFKVTAVPILLD